VKWLLLIGYALCVPVANWMIGHAGTECIPNGPCVIPVGFGLIAPSGVLMIGVALVMRDALQSALGMVWALAAIAIGTILSGLVAPPALVLASVLAFGIGEIADLAVYTPLRKRNLIMAVLLSGIAGAVIDSAAFLIVAFGSLNFLAGQVVGKAWVTIISTAYLAIRPPHHRSEG